MKEEHEIMVFDLIAKNQIPEIKSLADYQHATDIATLVRNKRDEMEKERKEFTDPLLKEQKRIKAEYDVYVVPLDKLVTEIKARMSVWIEAEQKRKDEEQYLLEQKAMQDNPDTSELIVDIVNDIKRQEGEEGTSTASRPWTFEVVNLVEVPRELMVLDEKAVKELIKSGKRVIPGLRIFQETKIVLRTK